MISSVRPPPLLPPEMMTTLYVHSSCLSTNKIKKNNYCISFLSGFLSLTRKIFQKNAYHLKVVLVLYPYLPTMIPNCAIYYFLMNSIDVYQSIKCIPMLCILEMLSVAICHAIGGFID